MFYHNLDPILFDFGFLEVRWYSLAYIFGILIGWWYGKIIIIKKFQTFEKKFNLTLFDDLITYLIISIILGGRLGYVIFYDMNYYLKNPFDIVKIWQGGMSFHGACLGVGFTTWLFCYHHRCSFIHIMDLLLPWVPVGLFLGRLANFVNGELPGRVTEVSWAVIFKHTDWLPRHPSPLYEALGEGVCLGVLLYCVAQLKRKGMVTCSFLMGYGLIRSVLECFREPDPQIGYLWSYFTLGQFLSMAMMVVSMVMVFMVMRPSLRYHKHQQKAC